MKLHRHFAVRLHQRHFISVRKSDKNTIFKHNDPNPGMMNELRPNGIKIRPIIEM